LQGVWEKKNKAGEAFVQKRDHPKKKKKQKETRKTRTVTIAPKTPKKKGKIERDLLLVRVFM